MKLVHTATGQEVKVGDKVRFSKSGEEAYVSYFRKPHSPASNGHISVTDTLENQDDCFEYYVSVFDLEWIDREDRR